MFLCTRMLQTVGLVATVVPRVRVVYKVVVNLVPRGFLVVKINVSTHPQTCITVAVVELCAIWGSPACRDSVKRRPNLALYPSEYAVIIVWMFKKALNTAVLATIRVKPTKLAKRAIAQNSTALQMKRLVTVLALICKPIPCIVAVVTMCAVWNKWNFAIQAVAEPSFPGDTRKSIDSRIIRNTVMLWGNSRIAPVRSHR